MKGSGEEPCRWSSLFYHTHDVTSEAEDWWRNSLRQLDLPITAASNEEGNEGGGEGGGGRGGVTWRGHRRAATASAAAAASRSLSPTKDASTRAYLRRVRSLSRENKQRQEAREREVRRQELEERRRREHILIQRKKERDTLMSKFLREPLRQAREAKKASCSLRGGEAEDEDKVRMCQSVPNLDEALRLVRREDQALDARARAFQSPPQRRRRPLEEGPTCDRFVRTHARLSLTRRAPVPATRPFPPGTSDVIRENQKPYPTLPPEELESRMRRRGRRSSSENVVRGGSGTQPLKARAEAPPQGLPAVDSHVVVLPRPRLDRRSSMPDLRDFRCVSSTVVYETIAALSSLGAARGLLVVPPGSASSPSPRVKASPEPPQRWAKRMNEFIEAETQAVLRDSPLLGPAGPDSAGSAGALGRRSQRREWVSKHSSVKTLQKNILSASLTDSASQTESLLRPPSPGVHRRGAPGSDPEYYDSLEEDDGRASSHQGSHLAFYVPIKDQASRDVAFNPTLPPRLTARLEERRATLPRRPQQAQPLALTGIRVPLLSEVPQAPPACTEEATAEQDSAAWQEVAATTAAEGARSSSSSSAGGSTSSESDIQDSARLALVRQQAAAIPSPATLSSASDIVAVSSPTTSPRLHPAVDALTAILAAPQTSQDGPRVSPDGASSLLPPFEPDLLTQDSPALPVHASAASEGKRTVMNGDAENMTSPQPPATSPRTKDSPQQPLSPKASPTPVVNGTCSGEEEEDAEIPEETPAKADHPADYHKQSHRERMRGNAADADEAEADEVEEDVSRGPESVDSYAEDYDSDSFLSYTRTCKTESDYSEAVSSHSLSESTVPVESSGLETNESCSGSEGGAEASESVMTEEEEEEEAASEVSEVSEEQKVPSVREIVGFVSSGKEMLLESGFVDCDATDDEDASHTDSTDTASITSADTTTTTTTTTNTKKTRYRLDRGTPERNTTLTKGTRTRNTQRNRGTLERNTTRTRDTQLNRGTPEWNTPSR